jgi:hypothetical protein
MSGLPFKTTPARSSLYDDIVEPKLGATTVQEAIDALKQQAPGPTATRTLASFDPGPQDPRRWNTALESAEAAMAVDPFVLLIDATYSLTEQWVLSRQMIVTGAQIGSLQWTVSGNAGIRIPHAASYTSIEGLGIGGPHPFYGAFDVGMLIEGARCRLNRVVFSNWNGIGLHLDAAVQSGTDANQCVFYDLIVALCGNNLGIQDGTNAGIRLVGGDANGCLFSGCVIVDCRRGVLDQSFLGNTYVMCTVESCNDRFTKNPNDPTVGYGFITTNANARSTFCGCYTESDSESDVVRPAIIVGGISADQPNRGTAPRIGQGIYPGYGIGSDVGGVFMGTADGIPADNLIAYFSTGLALPVYTVYGRSGRPWFSWNYANLGVGDIWRWKPYGVWTPYDFHRGDPNSLVGGLREVVAADTASAATSDGLPWQVGDRLIIRAPASGQPSTYRCTAVDGQGVPTWKVESTVAP